MSKTGRITSLALSGLFILLSCFPYKSPGQSIQVNKDSLLKIWYSPRGNVSDSIRRNAGFRLLVLYSRNHADSLLLLSREMESEARATQNSNWKAYAYYGYCRYFHFTGKSDSALLYAQKGTRVNTGIDSVILAETYQMLGSIWDARGNLDSAIYYYRVSLEIFLRNKNDISTGRAYANIGSAHQRKQEYIKALEYFEKARKYSVDQVRISLLVNTGYLLHQLMQYDEALSNFEQAIQIAEHNQDALSMIPACAGMAAGASSLEEVRKWSQRGIYLCDSLGQTIHRPRFFFTIGMRHLDSLQMDTAEYYLNRCRVESSLINDKIFYLAATTYLTDLYSRKGLHSKTLLHCKEVLPDLEQMNLQGYLKVVYNSMSKSLAATGRYEEAYSYLGKKDSLNDIDEREQLNNSVIKEYLAYKHLQEKEKLQQSKMLADMRADKLQEQIRSKYLIIGLTAAILLSIIGFQIQYIRFKDRAAKELEKVNLELETERQHLVVSNNKLRRFSSIVSHDILSNLDLILSTGHVLVSNRPTQENLTQYYDMTQRTSRQLKDYCLGLLEEARRLPVKAQSALTDPMPTIHATLASFGPALRAANFQVELGELSPSKLPIPVVEQLFQNLISNTLRHAATGPAPLLRIAEETDKMGRNSWLVEDSGPGVPVEKRELIFSPQGKQNDSAHHVGLSLLKASLQELGADIWVEERPGGGARWIILHDDNT